MNTRIVRMLRFGRNYSVHLECGCKFSVTPDQARVRQMVVGKQWICNDCGLERQ